MVTKTLTATVDAANAATYTEQYAKIVRVIRNLEFLKFRDKSNVIVPVRDESNPSPMKQSASNRQPGQTNTRSAMDKALNRELAKARYLMDDLADHVFGHIVSTELARDILRQFIDRRIVEVFEGEAALNPDSDSEDVQRVVEQAFEDADMHDCIRPGTESDRGEPGSSSTDTKGKGKEKHSKGRGKRKQKVYSFKWSKFP
ncbi:hypothetical protein OG21DRAFT_444647, partial [Imleria badia]